MVQLNLNLTYEEVKQLVQFVKDLKKVNYSVIIASNKRTNDFEIDFKEV